MQSSMLVYMLL